MLVGRKTDTLPKTAVEFCDVYAPNELWCGVYGAMPPDITKDDEETPLGDVMSLTIPRSFWDELAYRKVSTSFIQACAQTLQRISTPITVTAESDSVALMPVEQADGRIRIAIKNRTTTYARPQINIGQPIQSVEVLTSFPSVAIRPEGSKFSIRVPGRGITVVEVVTKER